ncbi:MAG TPA: hypothetical protein VGB74_12070 [Actinoplanes sp.]
MQAGIRAGAGRRADDPAHEIAENAEAGGDALPRTGRVARHREDRRHQALGLLTR